MKIRIGTKYIPVLLLSGLFLILFTVLTSPAQKVRLRSHVDPECAVSGPNRPQWKFADIGADGDVAVQGTTSCTGVFIYDLSDPDNIVLASHFDPAPGQISFTEAVVVGNRGYFGTGVPAFAAGVFIVDLTDPYNPSILGQVNPRNGNGFPAVHEMEIWGNYLVAVNQSGSNKIIKFVNVSDPANPVFVRDLVTQETSNIHATHIRGNRLFASGFGGFQTRGRTIIYDISEIETREPIKLAEFFDVSSDNLLDDRQIHSSWASEDGNYLYVVREMIGSAFNTSGELRVYDIHDPTQPFRVNKINGAMLGLNASSAHNPVVKGDRLYVSWYEGGLQVFDISDPVNPVRIGQYDSFPEPFTGEGGILNKRAENIIEPMCGFLDARSGISAGYEGDWAVYPFLGDDRILLGDMNTGMYVVDVTQIDQPIKNRASDFDGDRKTDISVYRPGTGHWFHRSSSTGETTALHFGMSDDIPAAGDYDGDGKADQAVFRPSDGHWYMMGSASGYKALHFGTNGDIPVAADYDADGRTDAAVWRPSEGIWYINRSTLGFTSHRWGTMGDKPFTGDHDGDGKADVIIYRPSEGFWYILPSSSSLPMYIPFGLPNIDKAVAGDFDGDNRADIAVYRPTTGEWFIQNTGTGTLSAYRFGISTDVPVPADYDGDNRSDIAVFRPSESIWYKLSSIDGAFSAEAYGTAGDMPSPATIGPGL